MKTLNQSSEKRSQRQKATIKGATPPVAGQVEWSETEKPWGDPCARTLALMTQMDGLLHTLHSRKITINAIRTLVKLYLSSADEKSTLGLTKLAAQMNVTTACITGMADNVEDLGFAERTINPEDRRRYSIRLTPLGIGFVEWMATTLVQEPTLGHSH
ncbi:MAG: MarR family transcriptional regulator [Luteolibacter sp.]